MRKCNELELKRTFGEWAKNNVNSMCIDDPTQLRMEANWDLKQYKVPYFMIVECKNTTEKVCATPMEIQDFLRSSTIKASMLKTISVESLYEGEGD